MVKQFFLSLWSILQVFSAITQALPLQTSRNPAHPESFLQRYDNSVNNIHFAQNRFPNITGQDKVASIKERRFDTLDADLRNRSFSTAFTPRTQDGHATEMATLMAGNGSTGYNGRGAAPRSRVTSASFDNLLPEPADYYRSNNITIQNHSYGTGIENMYAEDAAAYDHLMWTDTALLHIFSAGNLGGNTPGSGRYAGIQGFSNLTGSFKMSKNSISVGATDSFYQAESRSSRGPAYDGRIKPELVAFGVDGSSGAAALVSGCALLLQDLLHRQTGNLPSAALVKSLLITGALRPAHSGPDYVYGFGHLDAFSSLNIANNKQYKTGKITPGNPHQFNLEVPEKTAILKLTLCWTDTAARAGAPKSLINDLDLTVIDPVGNKILPWILSVFPQADSLKKPATRGTDTLNNTEQVTIAFPPKGNFTIAVNAKSLSTSSQSWAVSWDMVAADSFYFTYPVSGIPANASSPLLIRWKQSFAAGTTGVAEYRFTTQNSWIRANGQTELQSGFKTLAMPDTNTLMQFRMNIGGRLFIGDTFFLAKAPAFEVGYACADTVLLVWKPMKGIQQYKIYVLGNTQMQPIGTTSDTIYKIPANLMTHDQVTVAALSRENPAYEFRAPTKKVSFQGVGCYFRNFIAQWDNGSAILNFLLGTTYNISSAMLQKQKSGRFETIQTISPVTMTAYKLTDNDLSIGANTYRVVLNLLDGRTVSSNLQTLIQPNSNGWWVYPNPVKRSGRLNIINRWSETENLLVDIYDAQGRKTSVKVADLIDNSFVINNLAAGMYFLVFHDGKNRLGTDKLLVLP